MRIDMLDIEARIDRGEKLSKAESSKIMRYLNKEHLNRMDYPVDIELEKLDIFESQAQTRAKIRLNTDYSKIK